MVCQVYSFYFEAVGIATVIWIFLINILTQVSIKRHLELFLFSPLLYPFFLLRRFINLSSIIREQIVTLHISKKYVFKI